MPPFAARHAASARAGFAPRNFVCVLCGWPPKRGVPAVWKHAAWKACVPDDQDPSSFDWTWVAGFDVFVVDTRKGGGSMANRVLQAISAADEQSKATAAVLGAAQGSPGEPDETSPP